ncbi:sterile alpha motif domain-containing protein 9-like [Spea bombifrons]|uniref:sterile alpha motif domain-containing protein 9-like n=1 Tax=Spea bombifrons TaxID=233779 RepID=UPI00234BD918|nr:sterile alpha motif domain-containing protein 9-like [Spea bombifrons]
MDDLNELPTNVGEWTKDHVKLWVTKQLNIDLNEADILHKQNVTGEVLKILLKKDFIEMGITHGTAILITNRLKSITSNNVPQTSGGLDAKCGQTKKGGGKTKQKNGTKQDTNTLNDESFETNETNEGEKSKEFGETDQIPSKVSCTPYSFDRYHESKRYIQHQFLQPESGTSNYMDPVHEYKEFTNTANATEDDKKMKFCNEVFRFAAACMNARTNGTIHFGVRDKPHGEIIGIQDDNHEKYIKYIEQMISKYFEERHVNTAKQCIRPPRFVDVLSGQNTVVNRVVIEVDVVPAHSHCKEQIFCTHQQDLIDETWKRSKEMSCFIRDGESSKNIYPNERNNKSDMATFASEMKLRDNDRKRAEEIHKAKPLKAQKDGPKLVRLITGNRDVLDNSYYKWYILVANKSHPSQTNHLEFMHELKWFAVLDFDSESLINGLCKSYKDKRGANLHFPDQYQNMDNISCEKLEVLKLYQQTSWIFCNGRSDLDSKEYEPLNYRLWQKEKAAEVRRLISFLSRKDVLERGRFLVVFLLLSPVEDPADPMNEAFSTFYQELGGMNDILCICESEQTFQKWRDLQARLVSAEDIDERCIYYLDIKNINGTILKLKSVMQSDHRFLPSHGSSSIVLQKKDEDLMTCLDILCSNECQDAEIEKNEQEFNKFKTTQEEHFYKGGKASWWNFYFSAEGYTGPFIKRDVHDKLKDLIETWSQCDKQINVKIITLYHHPGCGGTTSAMHILWELKDKFRCATLKRKTDNFTDIANEVTQLAIYGSNSTDYFPVLLLVDDYEENENLYVLQNQIRTAIAENCIRYEKPVVIILNCMRSQNPEESSKTNSSESVSLKHKLSPLEQKSFKMKLREIEQQHDKPEDFYSFMIMKTDFDESYIRNVVRNLLKGLQTTSKEAELISFLALLNKYVKNSTISASMCEEFLGITTATQSFWGRESIEDKMGKHVTILIRTEVEEYGRFEGLRIIHPLIARGCIEELKTTYNLQQSKIMLQLLNTSVFYYSQIGKEMFSQNMQSMLVTRHRKEHGDEADTLFSPLIEEIQKEEGNETVESILKEGSSRFNQYPYIFQALARHYYIREKNFILALQCVEKAKKIAPHNSFVLDTFGQIYKTQLKSMMDGYAKNHSITPTELRSLLDTAVLASDAFLDCQKQAKKTEDEREESDSTKSKRYNVFNTAGYLGHIEVCLYTVDILLKVQWFSSKNELSRKHLVQYLSGKSDISLDKDHEEFCIVLKDFRYFLTKVKSYLRSAFDFFGVYFVHMKQKNILKESAEFKTRTKVKDLYNKYIQFFCDQDLIKLINNEGSHKTNHSLLSEKYRAGLEAYKALNFPGILEYLTDHGKGGAEMEAIVQAYQYLLKNGTDKYSIKDKENFILANIVLQCIYPNSKHICSIDSLKQYLREVLQKVGFEHENYEPYFLAVLLFWPQNMHQLDADSKNLEKCVNAMRKSFRGHNRYMCHAKQPIAHFYLGQNKGLKKIIHKGKIDQYFSEVADLNTLWQCGDIWKEKETANLLMRVKGRTGEKTVFVECGSSETIKIPVRPVYLGQLRSGRSIERVSFFLGFSIDGPIAYNIESI